MFPSQLLICQLCHSIIKSQMKYQDGQHTRVLGTSSKSVSGSKPCWVTKTIVCSERCWNIPMSFWQAETITSSDSSGFNEPTNLLNSTAYNVMVNTSQMHVSHTKTLLGQFYKISLHGSMFHMQRMVVKCLRIKWGAADKMSL